jgi:hypothetical protein
MEETGDCLYGLFQRATFVTTPNHKQNKRYKKADSSG